MASGIRKWVTRSLCLSVVLLTVQLNWTAFSNGRVASTSFLERKSRMKHELLTDDSQEAYSIKYSTTCINGTTCNNAADHWEDEQRLKREQYRQACEAFQVEQHNQLTRGPKTDLELGSDEQLLQFVSSRKNLSYMIVNEKYKLILCEVPKLCSTLWKKVLIALQDPKNRTVDEISEFDAHGRSNLSRLWRKYTTEEIVFRLKTYTKIMTVRDPLERLLSAFVSKFTPAESQGVQDFYDKLYGHEWISILRNKTNPKEPLKFEEMLEILSRRGLPTTSFNRHWMPIYDTCHPCSLRYDFIANFTTLERDANEILGRVLRGSSKSDLRFPAVKKSTTGERLAKLLPTLDPELVRDIKEIYRKDYEMFGYPIL